MIIKAKQRPARHIGLIGKVARFKGSVFLGLAILGFLLVPAQARAEDSGLHYLRAGALLGYSDTVVKLLYSAIIAKDFDPALANTLSEDLEQALTTAKASVDRSSALLPENQAKLEPELKKLRDAVKQAEDQLAKLTKDMEAQTAHLTDEAPANKKLAAPPGEKAAGGQDVDFSRIKTAAGWLYQDLSNARKLHAGLAKAVGGSAAAPPKPAGKRE